MVVIHIWKIVCFLPSKKITSSLVQTDEVTSPYESYKNMANTNIWACLQNFFKHLCSSILFNKMQATYLSIALYLLSSITLLTENWKWMHKKSCVIIWLCHIIGQKSYVLSRMGNFSVCCVAHCINSTNWIFRVFLC